MLFVLSCVKSEKCQGRGTAIRNRFQSDNSRGFRDPKPVLTHNKQLVAAVPAKGRGAPQALSPGASPADLILSPTTEKVGAVLRMRKLRLREQGICPRGHRQWQIWDNTRVSCSRASLSHSWHALWVAGSKRRPAWEHLRGEDWAVPCSASALEGFLLGA